MFTIDHHFAVKTCTMLKMANVENRAPKQDDTVKRFARFSETHSFQIAVPGVAEMEP